MMVIVVQLHQQSQAPTGFDEYCQIVPVDPKMRANAHLRDNFMGFWSHKDDSDEFVDGRSLYHEIEYRPYDGYPVGFRGLTDRVDRRWQPHSLRTFPQSAFKLLNGVQDNSEHVVLVSEFPFQGDTGVAFSVNCVHSSSTIALEI